MQPSLPSILEVAKAGTFGIKLPALPPHPFVGLRPFNSDEALLFFGRREQAIELMQQLHRTHFVAVVGSSGCGKSSLVRAGLVPKLAAGFLAEDRDQWLILLIKPGTAPFRNLAEKLLSAMNQAVTEAALDDLVADLRARGVAAVLERLEATLTEADANLLLLVDQFEEIFRFGIESNNPVSRKEATKFVELLLALSGQRLLPIYVVMTMRSDFIGDCDNFHGLPEAMNRSQYLVPRLTRAQLRQSVEGPINLFGGSIAPPLVERVLDDVGDQADQLPVMQHALMRTWEEGQADHARSGQPQIEIAHYEAVGGIKDALSRDAEAALSGMSAEDLQITERMFQALTDTDARGRRIRRPVRVSEIANIVGADQQRVLAIIERFISGGRSFLTLTKEADPLVDISHESLIRQWERMSGWVEAEAESRAIYLRLVDAAQRQQKGLAEYWRGTDLQVVREWIEQRNPNQRWAARYSSSDDDFNLAKRFLVESEKIRNAEVARKKRIVWSVISATIMVFSVLFVLGWVAILKDNQLRREIYRRDIKSAEEEFRSGNYVSSINLLSRYLPNRSSIFQTDLPDQQWHIRWLQVHDEFVTLTGPGLFVSAAFSPNGKMLALASWNRTINLWDTDTGKTLATLKGHEAPVRSVAFSPDGKTLASASWDKTIKLWDISSHQTIATLTGHKAQVTSVTFSPDGRTLASASYDSTIKLWDTGSRHLLFTLEGHSDAVLSVVFSPDGKLLASTSNDNTIKLWDAGSRQTVAKLKGHEAAVISAAFSPDGKMLVSTSVDTTIKLWDTNSHQILTALKGHRAYATSVVISPDGKTLASASWDSTIKLWDISSRHTIATLKGHEAPVVSVAFSPDGKTLASTSYDWTIKLWDTRLRHSITTLAGHEDAVSVAFSPDGKTLASASADKTIKLWSTKLRHISATLEGHKSAVESVAFSPDGKMLASASSDETIRLWDRGSPQTTATLKGHVNSVVSVAFSPDGKTVASASLDKTIRLWDRGSRQSTTTLKGHENFVVSVAFSPDGKTLASASWDSTIKLWDAKSRQIIATLRGHETAVSSVAFSPDSKMLASASYDKTVKLWDAGSRQPLTTLKGHKDAVRSVAFSPDGWTLASASNDGMINLWSLNTHQTLATLKGHEGIIYSIAFSPDSKTLASAGVNSFGKEDVAIRLWFVGQGEEVARQRNK